MADKTSAKPISWLRWALIAWGLALALIVAADGEIVWRIVRSGAVLAVTAGALALAARTRRWGALAALLLGIVGLAAGFAIGARSLMLGGVSLRAVAGIVLLAAGLALVIGGVGGLVSGLRRGWKVVFGFLLALAIIVSLWIITPPLVATNMPPVPPGGAMPADFGMTAREVRFASPDGVDLWAWYVPSQNGAAVVLRHGSSSTAEDALPQAAVLARNGYGVLITDARGHGRSAGRAMDFGWHGDADIAGAVAFLDAQPDVSGKIAVMGLSMGGEEALGAAGSNGQIAAVVAEGATGRTDADKAWLAEMYGTRGQLQVGIERLQYGLADLLTDASKPTALADAARAAAPRPVLLIAAEKMPDEGDTAAYIQRSAKSNVTTWVVPGAEHTGGLSAAPQEWERRVIDFLDAALLGR